MKVKKALLLLIVLLLAFAAVSATLANDVAEGRTRNIITTGKVDIAIRESTNDDNPFALKGTITDQGTIEFTDVVPSKAYSKEVTIYNAAEEACWLRVKVDISVTEPEEGVTYRPADVVKPNYDQSGAWLRRTPDDGYFYYSVPLEKNASTDPQLFTQVLFAPQMGNEYAGKQIQMNITAEATQCKNNMPESNSVFDALGWPESGEGGV